MLMISFSYYENYFWTTWPMVKYIKLDELVGGRLDW